MSITRLSTDASLPQRDWQSFFTILPNSTAQVPLVPNIALGMPPGPVLCERALLRVASASPSKIRIGPAYPGSDSGTLWVELSPNDEYELSAQPGTTFDITKWYAQAEVAAVNNVVTVIYQN